MRRDGTVELVMKKRTREVSNEGSVVASQAQLQSDALLVIQE
jgi:hypothetical protein